MTTVDDVCAVIAASTDVLEIQRELIPLLKSLEKANSRNGSGKFNVLEQLLENGEDPLNVLDPATSSVGYLYILNARLDASREIEILFAEFLASFASTFDVQQTRLVPGQIEFLGRQIVRIACNSHMPQIAIGILRTLILRYAEVGYLTALHGLLLQTVVVAADFSHAQEFLLMDLREIDQTIYPLKYQDHLLYHYLGGVILGFYGRYDRAVEFLETCASAPGSAVSAIQVDAYKKLLLMQLLAYNESRPLLKYTSHSSSNAYRNLCAAYMEYAAAYQACDTERIQKVLSLQHQKFESDHNFGLVQLCDRAYRRRSIQRLNKVYTSLTFGDLIRAVNMPITEVSLANLKDDLLQMIKAGDIHGSVSGSSTEIESEAIITFSDPPESFKSRDTGLRLTAATQSMLKFEDATFQRDRQIGGSDEFLQKASQTPLAIYEGEIHHGDWEVNAEALGQSTAYHENWEDN